MYNRLKPIKSKENEEKMGVVNLHRKEGGHVHPDLGGQYHRILQNTANPELNFALQSENKDERKSAKDRLKELYLNEFKKDIKNDETYFSEFYKLSKLINKKMKNATKH